MKFQGRILRVLPVYSDTSKNGNVWQKQEFVFEYYETPEQRWADRVPLYVMNDRIKEYDLHEGDEVEIGFGHNAREYNGRLYADFSIYSFKKLKSVGDVAVPEQQTQQTQQKQVRTDEQKAAMEALGKMGEEAANGGENGSSNDLPF
jgi:hypothetical protein